MFTGIETADREHAALLNREGFVSALLESHPVPRRGVLSLIVYYGDVEFTNPPGTPSDTPLDVCDAAHGRARPL